jgi:uncharacterized cupin superfamily protein
LTPEATPTLSTDVGATELSPGMCAGFPAGGPAHHLESRSNADALILEIGDHGIGDSAIYPDDGLVVTTGPNGNWA